jgi:hypothetical protein
VPTQLLFYEAALPVSAGRHGKWSVEVGGDYAFSRNVNSVPLMAVEFAHAALEYAIVFAGREEEVMPAVVLGLRRNDNRYLTDAGAWDAKYIPAFVRRYPFVFSSDGTATTFTLCIDEAFKGFNQQGRGERLFGDDGKPTPYVQRVLNFLQEYQAQFQRTQALCRKLRELELLDPMEAQVTLKSGAQLSLTGFMVVNRERLRKLSGEVLTELVKTDDLELIYTHLQSMGRFSNIVNRVAGTGEAGVSGQGEAGKEAGSTAPAGTQ